MKLVLLGSEQKTKFESKLVILNNEIIEISYRNINKGCFTAKRRHRRMKLWNSSSQAVSGFVLAMASIKEWMRSSACKGDNKTRYSSMSKVKENIRVNYETRYSSMSQVKENIRVNE